MSELKAYKMVNEMYCTDVRVIPAEVYFKSEADKVIAEKDKEIAELKEQVHYYAQGLYVMQARAEKEARHQKYKRCLAMAKVCYLRFVRYENYLQKLCASNATIAAYKFRRDMYDKWEKRWRELAEEPTWAKFLQLIRKETK